MAHTSLTEELLHALKQSLIHLKTLRMASPDDQSISHLKRTIRQKISEIEKRRSKVQHVVQQPSH